MSTHHRLPKASTGQSKGRVRTAARWSRRARRPQLATQNTRAPFAPPEDWHEPLEDPSGYKIVVQTPGEGYRHVVTPD